MVPDYLRKLDEIRGEVEATPELSLREPLLQLIRAFSQDAGRPGLLIALEANAEEAGQPDIFVKDGPRLVGFVETKAPDANLDRLLRSQKQLKRYRESLGNWVLTDYYRFVFIRDDETVGRADVYHEEDLKAAFHAFFSYTPPVIRSPSKLAHELARRARLLRDGLEAALNREPEQGPLRSILDFYQRTWMDDLDESGFADTFAQAIVYGMFLTWLGLPGDAEFTRVTAANSVPQSVPFLRSALRLIRDDDILIPPVSRLLDDLAALFDNTQPGPIRESVSAGGIERDLVIYFYEQFLEKYDAGERRDRGVYYTPPELVDYLIRAVQLLLVRDFGLERGLANPAVTLLDPAVGTGTFILGAVEMALSASKSAGSAVRKKLIRDHLVTHFYGFELLPAPYAVAHLKLSSFFHQAGYELGASERIRVYLTNSLESRDPTGQQIGYIPTLRGIEEEGLAAGRIKDETPVLVITGNPPYDRTSHNANPHSNRLMEDFYLLDEGRLRDRNSAPLKDDYLRFIRWAVWKLLDQDDSPKHGIIAFVTNRAFIERKLHRGVRRFLFNRFDEIYVFDLHGDQREWYADRVDEKVFAKVQAGIVLTVFVKRPGEYAGPKIIRYREQYGTRPEKFLACKEATLDDAGWNTIEPRSPLWMFVNYEVPKEYDTWPTVAQLMPESRSGVQTHRDQLVVAFTEADLRERLARFADQRVPNSFWEEQDVKSNRDWNLSETRASLRSTPPRNVMRWTFRPFDRRWIAFDQRLIDYTRTEISPHLLARPDNLCLAFATGSLVDGPYAFMTRTPVPAAVLSWRTFGAAYFGPELLQNPVTPTEWLPNLPESVLERLTAGGIQATARGVMEYVYAILNTPSYRTVFAHGLRYDFARIPFTKDAEAFELIRRIGSDLIAYHLLEHPALEAHSPPMDGDDQDVIADPRYDETEQAIHLGANLIAGPVPASVWAYQQGAYPVVRKYLEARAGRRLDGLEFQDFRLMVAAVLLTLERLPELSELLPRAVGDTFSSEELGLVREE